MSYLLCIPAPTQVSRENCEKIHNILARMSDKYRLNIIPEPVRMKQGKCPDFYRKYRIYKEIPERDASAEAYLLPEEEEMFLSVCRNADEQKLMRGCTYAYQYPACMVLKAFREERRDRRKTKQAQGG